MMMRKLLVLVAMWVPFLVFANSNVNIPEKEGIVKGKIYDQKSKNPVEYATVAVYRSEDNSVVTGTITDNDGQFKIKGLQPGSFYIVVSFLGYDDMRYDDVLIEKGRDLIDLGDINLGAASTSLAEVEVVSERQTVEYHIDKKVVSVGKQMTSASLSAIEVLENVPSIRVDIEGNVALRGSTGFTVLIDGKPTVLDPSDVLRQTPASTIQNIEIITNPSAKYQPDGTGGIINIITKKNRMQGLQGLFNLKAGSFGMHGGDFMLNYRKKNININFGADYNDRPFPGTSYNERHTTSNDIKTVIKADGDSERAYVGGSLRGGIDWDITDRDAFTFGFRVGDFNMNSNSQLDYFTTKIPDDGTGIIREFSLNESGRGGQYYSLTSNYTHKFAAKGHELAAQLNYRFRDGDEHSMNVLKDASQLVNDGTKTTEKGPSGRWELRLDYVKPVGEEDRFEAGFQGRRSQSEDATEFFIWDTNTEDFINQPDFSNNTDYIRNIMGLYSLYNGKVDQFGYQLGLRGEYTFREITTVRDNERFEIDRWDLFPTVHLSYQLPKENQVMASYSRRIDRPRGHYLEPFITWQDMYNVRQGNPDLLPEYIDALDIGYLKQWEKSQLSLEGYYRVTHNKVERIQGVYDDGILLHTYDNVGTDYSLGAEAMYNLPLFKWWEMNLMGNVYDYRIKGVKYDEPFERSSFNWSSRVNNTFRIKKNMQIQLDSSYDSPTVTTQGETKGYYAFNAAYRVDLFDRKFSAVLQARDVFSTTKRVRISEDVGFYNYNEGRRNSPVLSFTLTYRLNNFKVKRGNRNGGGEGMDDEL
ncbi:TonB-dependent receptor domain-containing protein [Carboxylicivirga sp. N1Y90]|uniref:TonB-dependent receptor domain-containing protein n=1 Tax=Carboxylicivirga fragile TaxID=3417571 RepID=UPI003D3336A6|nr:TonB-dependent receptor [Marinilabiliaceae bacterium N1Y90]